MEPSPVLTAALAWPETAESGGVCMVSWCMASSPLVLSTWATYSGCSLTTVFWERCLQQSVLSGQGQAREHASGSGDLVLGGSPGVGLAL